LQNDFCEGGALACDGGHEVANKLHEKLKDKTFFEQFDYIFASRDWHVDPNRGAVERGEQGHFETWPQHCKAYSNGARFSPAWEELVDKSENHIITVNKGLYDDDYSFLSAGGFIDGSQNLSVQDILKFEQDLEFTVCGIATSFCVANSCKDLREYFPDASIMLWRDLCVDVAGVDTEVALSELADLGIDWV
jgi:nicotinamidase/pyrazinamidase